MKVFNDLEQGSDEWFEVRRGVPTASMFHAVMAKGKNGQQAKTRQTYMCKLAGEIITGQMQENFTTQAMERGHVMEIEARNLYEFETDNTVEQVGFILDDDIGCSPDGLIDDDGMLEIKSKAPHILIDVLLKCEMPTEHKAQVQGQMMVADRSWCDFVAYYKGMPMLIKRVNRDDDYIDVLRSELDVFNNELKELVRKITSL